MAKSFANSGHLVFFPANVEPKRIPSSSTQMPSSSHKNAGVCGLPLVEPLGCCRFWGPCPLTAQVPLAGELVDY